MAIIAEDKGSRDSSQDIRYIMKMRSMSMRWTLSHGYIQWNKHWCIGHQWTPDMSGIEGCNVEILASLELDFVTCSLFLIYFSFIVCC